MLPGGGGSSKLLRRRSITELVFQTTSTVNLVGPPTKECRTLIAYEVQTAAFAWQPTSATSDLNASRRLTDRESDIHTSPPRTNKPW